MKKGGGISERREKKGRKTDGLEVIKNKMKMKNMQRLGGRGGLSLESFANAKSRNQNCNPSLIKKQREFYQNAKHVRKYKRSLKQQEQKNAPSTAERPLATESESEEGESGSRQAKKSKRNPRSLRELYNKKREEQETARIEREAMIQAKNEERRQSEARRRGLKEKMYKKTKSGQPVMKYRIEHLLETIQGSTS